MNTNIHILLLILHLIWLSTADFACESRCGLDREFEKSDNLTGISPVATDIKDTPKLLTWNTKCAKKVWKEATKTSGKQLLYSIAARAEFVHLFLAYLPLSDSVIFS